MRLSLAPRSSLSSGIPDVCIIDRTLDVDKNEAPLEYLSVYVQVVGTRPPVAPRDALLAIVAQFNLEPDPAQLVIRRVAPPEDFLLTLPDHKSVLTVLQGDRTVHAPGFSLRLKPWSRLANAEQGSLHHKALIELEGIPLHAWDRDTATDLLRPYCSIERVEPDTTSQRDLSVFRVIASTTRPEFISESRTLVIPEPANAVTPFQPARLTLKYTVKIRVRRLLVRMPPDSPPCSPPATPPSEGSLDEDDSPHQNPRRRRRLRSRFRRERCPSPAAGREPSPGAGVTWGPFVQCSGAAANRERRRSSGG